MERDELSVDKLWVWLLVVRCLEAFVWIVVVRK
jgi:hypothetical protein